MFVCAECGSSQPTPGHCGTDGSPLAPVGDDLLLGQTIGAYRVARLLGIGGMGRVYKGVHPTIGSRVAIKVLSRECSDRRDLVDRFFAEAKAVNLIRHESIVNVLDLATLPDGRPYIVMEYLDGAPLAAIIEHAQHSGYRLPMGGVAKLIVEVLDALAAAHAKGIVHRDLKPDNIYVTPAGRAKVLDFGIAKLQPEYGGSSTHTGSLMGTPHYMSAEQAAGRPVDLRADLYSIGVILFECMTLQRPFQAAALFDLLRMHVEAPPPSPRAYRPELPEPVESVIYTALAKLPDQRFGSAQAMSMALQHATSQLPADQWQPIQPSHVARTQSAGGWAPTPPASWAGSGSRGSTLANQATQTAGQVANPVPKPGSKKGLWIALAGVVVVGGGVTAAVLAGGDGGSKTAQSGSGSDPWNGSGSAIAVVPVPPDDKGDPDDPDDTDPAEALDDIDVDESGKLTDAQFKRVDATYLQLIPNIPLEALAMFPPELKAAIAKHGSWAKVPAADRKRIYEKIAAQGMGMGMVGGALAMSGDINAALGGGVSDPKTADGWVRYAELPMPSGAFDPKQVDAQKYVTWLIGEGKKLVPDATVFRVDVVGLAPTGLADFTAVDHGSVSVQFISPSRMKKDPKKPIGAKHEAKCMFRLAVEETGAHVYPLDGWECTKERLLGPPKCNLVQVWKKALAEKMPKNAIATLGYRDWSGESLWYFTIDDADQGGTKTFKDDC